MTSPPIRQADRQPAVAIIQAIKGNTTAPEAPENTHLILKATPLFLINHLEMEASSGTERAVLTPVPSISPQTT